MRLETITRVAVLGAGVMGAQIAAHLINADVATVLFDLPAEDDDPNTEVARAIKALGSLRPSPIASKASAKLIQAANYDHDLALLADCDLIIEAIAERLDWKLELYRRIAPYVSNDCVVASNTSGLSIQTLADSLPSAIRPRFCGVHFFNPPRYMRLVELIGCSETRGEIMDLLETFLVTTLGKGVVRAKDTPNFIANRLGVFASMAAIHHGDRLGLPPDLVDGLTGPLLGRPKSATFRTADVVGLDTLRHVVEGNVGPLKEDPWVGFMQFPKWMAKLVDSGALGQKTGHGIYRKQGKTIQVFDPGTESYREAGTKPAPEVVALLEIADPVARLAELRGNDDRQAQFLWSTLRDTYHYCAYHLAEIADTARDADLALRWGFGWQQGPFESWQEAGWGRVTAWIAEDIAAGRAMVSVPLPAWVLKTDKIHSPDGSFSPASGDYRGRSALPVYNRQCFPEKLVGETPHAFGETVLETDAVRLWRDENDIAVLAFKSKLNTISDAVLDGVLASIDVAERDFRCLVLWQGRPPFSTGADLGGAYEVLRRGDFQTFESMVAKFQRATGRLRYSTIPVVAAAQGAALGGGCEFLMYADRVVAALETYAGLVEIGVGLLPAGGGCTELARRVAEQAAGANGFALLAHFFETLATAKVSTSAKHAVELDLLRNSDVVVFNDAELLHVAKAQARAMAESGYRPPLQRPITVLGRSAAATLKGRLINMREGGFISAHDERIATSIADILCGGDVDPGTSMSEAWLLRLEREAFVELGQLELTQARIAHMLQTGKPLRN